LLFQLQQDDYEIVEFVSLYEVPLEMQRPAKKITNLIYVQQVLLLLQDQPCRPSAVDKDELINDKVVMNHLLHLPPRHQDQIAYLANSNDFHRELHWINNVLVVVIDLHKVKIPAWADQTQILPIPTIDQPPSCYEATIKIKARHPGMSG
jgi:hypothetical protein